MRLILARPQTRAGTPQLAPLRRLLALYTILLSTVEVWRCPAAEIVKVVASSSGNSPVIDRARNHSNAIYRHCIPHEG